MVKVNNLQQMRKAQTSGLVVKAMVWITTWPGSNLG